MYASLESDKARLIRQILSIEFQCEIDMIQCIVRPFGSERKEKNDRIFQLLAPAKQNYFVLFNCHFVSIGSVCDWQYCFSNHQYDAIYCLYRNDSILGMFWDCYLSLFQS